MDRFFTLVAVNRSMSTNSMCMLSSKQIWRGRVSPTKKEVKTVNITHKLSTPNDTVFGKITSSP